MSKLLGLGMSLEETVQAVTSRPAEVIGREAEIGSIAIGREADIAIFELMEETILSHDAYGNSRELERWLKVRDTIRKGVSWVGPYPHPGPMI